MSHPRERKISKNWCTPRRSHRRNSRRSRILPVSDVLQPLQVEIPRVQVNVPMVQNVRLHIIPVNFINLVPHEVQYEVSYPYYHNPELPYSNNWVGDLDSNHNFSRPYFRQRHSLHHNFRNSRYDRHSPRTLHHGPWDPQYGQPLGYYTVPQTGVMNVPTYSGTSIFVIQEPVQPPEPDPVLTGAPRSNRLLEIAPYSPQWSRFRRAQRAMYHCQRGPTLPTEIVSFSFDSWQWRYIDIPDYVTDLKRARAIVKTKHFKDHTDDDSQKIPRRQKNVLSPKDSLKLLKKIYLNHLKMKDKIGKNEANKFTDPPEYRNASSQTTAAIKLTENDTQNDGDANRSRGMPSEELDSNSVPEAKNSSISAGRRELPSILKCGSEFLRENCPCRSMTLQQDNGLNIEPEGKPDASNKSCDVNRSSAKALSWYLRNYEHSKRSRTEKTIREISNWKLAERDRNVGVKQDDANKWKTRTCGSAHANQRWRIVKKASQTAFDLRGRKPLSNISSATLRDKLNKVLKELCTALNSPSSESSRRREGESPAMREDCPDSEALASFETVNSNMEVTTDIYDETTEARPKSPEQNSKG